MTKPFIVIAEQRHVEITDEARHEGEGEIECTGCGNTGLTEDDTVYIWWATLDHTLPYCRDCNELTETSEEEENRLYQDAVTRFA